MKNYDMHVRITMTALNEIRQLKCPDESDSAFVRKAIRAYIDNIKRSQHGSVKDDYVRLSSG